MIYFLKNWAVNLNFNPLYSRFLLLNTGFKYVISEILNSKNNLFTQVVIKKRPILTNAPMSV